MIVDKTLLLMNYMRLVHYVAETTVTIIQDELFEPLIKYFSGEAEGLMVTAA